MLAIVSALSWVTAPRVILGMEQGVLTVILGFLHTNVYIVEPQWSKLQGAEEVEVAEEGKMSYLLLLPFLLR